MDVLRMHLNSKNGASFERLFELSCIDASIVLLRLTAALPSFHIKCETTTGHDLVKHLKNLQ